MWSTASGSPIASMSRPVTASLHGMIIYISMVWITKVWLPRGILLSAIEYEELRIANSGVKGGVRTSHHAWLPAAVCFLVVVSCANLQLRGPSSPSPSSKKDLRRHLTCYFHQSKLSSPLGLRALDRTTFLLALIWWFDFGQPLLHCGARLLIIFISADNNCKGRKDSRYIYMRTQ